jgi:hypothetical protein
MSLLPGYPAGRRFNPGGVTVADEISSAMPDTAGYRLWESLFKDHPRSLGESYWEHQRHAFAFGASMIWGGVACVLHALVPALFVRTASSTILRLHERLIATRRIDRRQQSG